MSIDGPATPGQDCVDPDSDSLTRAQFESIVEQLCNRVSRWTHTQPVDGDTCWLVYQLWWAMPFQDAAIEGLDAVEEDAISGVYAALDQLTETEFPPDEAARNDLARDLRNEVQRLACHVADRRE